MKESGLLRIVRFVISFLRDNDRMWIPKIRTSHCFQHKDYPEFSEIRVESRQNESINLQMQKLAAENRVTPRFFFWEGGREGEGYETRMADLKISADLTDLYMSRCHERFCFRFV